MDHNSIRHKLSEYIDGTVSPDERSMIEEHLKTCEKCSDALHELQKTIEHIKTVEEIDPPAWMTQKIMAKVRAEAEEKKTIFQRLFFPLAVKLPVQAVAVLFLTVTAYYVYQNINPANRYAETTREATAKKEVPASTAPRKGEGASVTKKDALDKMQSSTQRSKQVPQSPEYKALDMKHEYERPAPPTLEGKAAAPVPAPAKSLEPPMLAKKDAAVEKRALAPQTGTSVMAENQAAPAARAFAPAERKSAAAPQAGAPSIMREQSAMSGESGERMISKRKSMATAEGTATAPTNKFEQVVQERYPDDKPKLVVTFEISGTYRVKRAEERFNSNGERHGLQREYYESGRVKTEAQYGYGKLEWYREFQSDGVKKTGNSSFDWFWLKK